MPEERIIGYRSRAMRSATRTALAEARDGVSLYWAMSRDMREDQVPDEHREGTLMHLRDLLRAKGVTIQDPEFDNKAKGKAEESKPESKPEPEALVEDWEAFTSNFDNVESVGLGETIESGPTQRTRESSVYHTALQQYLDRWMATWKLPDQLPISWHPTKINGQKVWIVSTFKIRGENFVWNLTGKPDWDNHPVVQKCPESVLVYHEGRSVCLSRDLEGTLNVPAAWGKSLVKGTTQKIQFAVFLWLVKDNPGKELRFWVNEEKRSGEKVGDVHSFRLAMKPKKS